MKARVRDMFPTGRPWFSRGAGWLPVYRGSDEWGRHTLVLAIPFVGSVVFPLRPCDCEGMAEFGCSFPGCPFLALFPDARCVTHDVQFWAEEVAP